jgi:hypothetical protein
MLWSPTNADAVTQSLGIVVRSGIANTVLLARADSAAHSSNLVGTRLTDVATGDAGLIQSFHQSTVQPTPTPSSTVAPALQACSPGRRRRGQSSTCGSSSEQRAPTSCWTA